MFMKKKILWANMRFTLFFSYTLMNKYRTSDVNIKLYYAELHFQPM